MLYHEAQYIQMFAHRCISHFFGVKLDAKPLALVMEFLGEANKSITVHKLLFSHHCKNMKSNLCMKDWFSICYDIVDALNFFHNKGCLHCDVKTGTCLLGPNLLHIFLKMVTQNRERPEGYLGMQHVHKFLCTCVTSAIFLASQLQPVV